MTALYSNTHPKMEALQIQLWRQASPTQKMHMLAQLNASARILAKRAIITKRLLPTLNPLDTALSDKTAYRLCN